MYISKSTYKYLHIYSIFYMTINVFTFIFFRTTIWF